jgi:hypothetical protein
MNNLPTRIRELYVLSPSLRNSVSSRYLLRTLNTINEPKIINLTLKLLLLQQQNTNKRQTLVSVVPFRSFSYVAVD